MSKLKSIWLFICRHKYLITIAFFLIIIVFLDENNLIERFHHKREISTLKTEIEQYRKQYNEDTEKLNNILNKPEELEKIAREKYLMKKPNEDIFIIEE
ncbi:MAG: FtsB family cell division protein [Phocaeicola sp.]|uniref:FtsB family cell division protein n=1 Tax=Phocaeicola TaxID=909656 RepID=UPI00234F4020|nr:septum formation initiator family protein [Phocaeicola oris]MCE2617014.1 septum formation initiator family protein [Phocaeicola oris]